MPMGMMSLHPASSTHGGQPLLRLQGLTKWILFVKQRPLRPEGACGLTTHGKEALQLSNRLDLFDKSDCNKIANLVVLRQVKVLCQELNQFNMV